VQRLKTAEKERDNLTDSKLEVEVFLQKENEISRKKNILFQHNLLLASEKVEKSSERVREISEKLSSRKQEMKETDDLVTRTSREYEKMKAEYTQCQKELQTFTTVSDRPALVPRPPFSPPSLPSNTIPWSERT
jgi:chromosome segregation ATPase